MKRTLPKSLCWAATAVLLLGNTVAASGASSPSPSKARNASFDVIFAEPKAAERIRARAADGCWVVFHDGVDFVGSRLTLIGPIAVSDLGQSVPEWRRWNSAIVGPRANVTAFEDIGFRQQLAILQPGQRAADLNKKEFGWRKNMASVRISCS